MVPFLYGSPPYTDDVMPKLPDDMSNAAVQKRQVMTNAMKAAKAKEPVVVAAPKVRIAKGR